MQVTSRSQLSNGVQRVACDLGNPSDLHCQLTVGLIATDLGFAVLYTVILTRSWLNNPKLDPDPGLWWVLAVINVSADNLSQKQILPLPTNSERNQTSPQNWFKAKTLLSGEGLFILSSFLTLTLFEFWTPICKRVNFPNFQKAQNASHQSITNVKKGPASVLWSQNPLRSALSTQRWSNCHRLRLCWFSYSHFDKVLAQ